MQQLWCSGNAAIMLLHPSGNCCFGRGSRGTLENSGFCKGCAGRTYCDQVVCEAVVHEGVLGHLHSHAGHVRMGCARQAGKRCAG